MKIYTDLSNLMLTDFVSGIQRAVREIMVRMLRHSGHEFFLLSYDSSDNSFVRLDNERFLSCFADKKCSRQDVFTSEKIRLRDIPSGALFFDIDSVWNSKLKRSFLYPELKQRGIKIVTHIYDIIPMTHPQFCHQDTAANFIIYLGAVLKYSDHIIASAKATVDDIDALTDKLGLERKKCTVVPLSCDFAQSNVSGGGISAETVSAVSAGKYLLMLGTVEPRKNHSLLIDALESGLADAGMNIIIAGRIGWNVDALEKRIRSHPLFGKQLFFIEKPDDKAVDFLYKNAYAVAFPTFAEGFGLPMVEAFMRGTPVIASDIPVLREVAGDFAEYFDPHDKDSLVKCVKNLLNEPEKYGSLKEHLRNYVPCTWDESAENMFSVLLSVGERREKVPADLRVKQLVCLTARNDDMLASLPFMEEYMPFITEIVICCPDKNVQELKERYNGRFEMKFLTDSQVLDGRELPEDHTPRNFFLRCLALRNPAIDDVFIMTDDDYRPLRTLTLDDFVMDGAYKAHYCYDLRKWQGTYGAPTSFDRGMKTSLRFLEKHGYPTMMYPSHQMQMIDKRIFNEMVDSHPGMISSGCCEWCVYFNYGVGTHPDLFRSVPYVSMCWPGNMSDWELYVPPADLVYENHYHSLYEEGQVFFGLREDFNENTPDDNRQKIKRYSEQLRLQLKSKKVYDGYCEVYRRKHSEMPSFDLVCSSSGNIALSAPVFLRALRGAWTRLPLTVDRKIIKKLGAENITVNYCFRAKNGAQLTDNARIKLDIDRPELLLTVKAPEKAEKCVFDIRVLLEDKNMAASAKISADII